jgi:hypothetical protein
MWKFGAAIVAIIALGRGPCFAQTESEFLTACSFAKGDPVAMVKAFYGIHVDPGKFPAVKLGLVPYEGPTAYQYHFGQWGVWVFFDKDLHVNTIRFDPPFAGKIGGIALGDTVDRIRRVRGEPAHQLQGMPDLGALEKRKVEKANLLASLPHPASFEQRMEMVEDMARVDSRPLVMMTAWTYGALARDFFRYDISPEDNKVHEILANACDARS